ncbi:MAG: hypothetical protein OEZ51_10315 [Nitrospinota bacterium]|nr:hypothetical protein [Nitrospinota bacterium]
MRRHTRFLAVLVLWGLIVPAAWADDSKMAHIIFRFEDSSNQQNHFARQPKEMWRVGTQYLRLEEKPNPETHIHLLLIANEPHIYMINQYNNQGQHILDPGPVFKMHMPIFSSNPEKGGSNKEKEISKLEFGTELEFFKKNNARSMPHVQMKGKIYNALMLTIDGADLFLFTDQSSGLPVQLSVQSEKDAFVVHYEVYEAGLEPDLDLFKVPVNINIVEAKAQPAH